MAGMAGAASGLQAQAPEHIIIGAFGLPEEPQQAEGCSQEGCATDRTLLTDLYCGSHDRFLPLVRNWTNIGRVTVVVIAAAAVYGCFALAAQLSSWLPLFVVYAVTGLAAVSLPLRLFPLTVRITVAIWFVAIIATLTYHYTKPGVHATMVIALVIVAACALGLHSGSNAIQDAMDETVIKNDDRRPKTVLAFVAAAFTFAAAGGAVEVSLLLIPQSLVRGRSWLMPVAAITLATALALGLLIAIVAGLFDGAPRVSLDTPRIDAWGGLRLVTWSAQPTRIRRRRVHTVVDRMGEVLRRTLIRAADALHIASKASARTVINIFLTAVRIFVNGLIQCINFVVKVVVIIVRAIAAGVKSALWFCKHASRLVILYLIYAIVAVGLPVTALFMGAGFTAVAAEDTLRYLISGSLVGLLLFGLFASMGILLLTTAWITLASQRLGLSFRSAHHSASIAAPYGLLLVAAGGWIVGLPGTLGHGQIHVGWVTLVSTGILAAVFIWSQFINKAQDEVESDSSALTGQTRQSSGWQGAAQHNPRASH